MRPRRRLAHGDPVDLPDAAALRGQVAALVQSRTARTPGAARALVARRCGYPSWPRLMAAAVFGRQVSLLRRAIDAEDVEGARALMTRTPALHRAPLGYARNGPLTWVAECRIPGGPPSEARLALAAWMLEHGSDVHQGGDGPLMRAALRDDRIPMMELLVRYGADVRALWNGSYPVVWAACETLQPMALRWLLARGADPAGAAAMLVGTYARAPAARASCLNALADAGVTLPDTPEMALHRRCFDRLAAMVDRDPAVLHAARDLEAIYPPELGMEPGDGMGSTPVSGGTLLHLAVEFCDVEMARWLLDRGADPNARARPDGDGFGDHTPLFHAVVSLGPRDGAMACLLLERGANPGMRATLRQQLRDTGSAEKDRMHEFHGVTCVEYALQYQEPAWIDHAALDAIAVRSAPA